MGIRHLETFVRNEVPNGYSQVSVEDEIRNYYRNAREAKPPAPVIVIDVHSLYQPLSQLDHAGILCGGRFNYAFFLMDTFLARLKSIGTTLVFFYDGPTQDTKYNTWVKRQEDKYYRLIEIIDGVDGGLELTALLERFSSIIPNSTAYPVKYVAKKYGQFITSFAKECDQELAAYANANQAFAVISNDTDFMIFEGNWRYWSAKELNFQTLTTMEYNRLALVHYLGLNFKQMRLLATLGGNDLIQYEEVQRFHQKLGQHRRKFHNLANFVRQQTVERDTDLQKVLLRVFGNAAYDPDLAQRFQQSLDFYDTNYEEQNLNLDNDPLLDILLKQDETFIYQVWTGSIVNITTYFTDMRRNDLVYTRLVIPIIQRQAGMVLYHRQMVTDCSTLKLMVKLDHHACHNVQDMAVQFPQHITPPPLLDLLSKQPDICASLRETKQRLYCWIASDRLEYRQLQHVPDVLRTTVVTLYFLVEQRILQLFEADLFLQVAHDVAFETYDFCNLQYPRFLNPRAFRLAFLYCKIYNHFAKVGKLLIFTEGSDVPDYEKFDGALFHARYEEWSKQQYNAEEIKHFRLYSSLG